MSSFNPARRRERSTAKARAERLARRQRQAKTTVLSPKNPEVSDPAPKLE